MSDIVRSKNSLVDAVCLELDSLHTRKAYKREIMAFLNWIEQSGLTICRTSLSAYKDQLRSDRRDTSINLALAAIRKFVRHAATIGQLDHAAAEVICSIPDLKIQGQKTGRWLDKKQAEDLLNLPDTSTTKGLRDRVILVLLLGCGLRRFEAKSLTIEQIQQREGRWVLIDVRGKGNRIRTVCLPSWGKAIIDKWLERSGIDRGLLIRVVSWKRGTCRVFDTPLSTTGIWRAVQCYSRRLGFQIAPHDLRRTYAKLAKKNGAGLDQLMLSLGHQSLETTKRYLGLEIDYDRAPGDLLGLDVEV